MEFACSVWAEAPQGRATTARTIKRTARFIAVSPLQISGHRASRLCGHPFDPFCAECGSREWIRKVLCFPRNLNAAEFHDAHGVGRLRVICQDVFGDPKIAAANDSPDREPLIARLTSALALYVASTAGSLARMWVVQHRVLLIDE